MTSNADNPDRLGLDHLDKLDRVLLEQDTLLPSSGFAASVMDAIQQQATAPAPIPFPWKWALPGIAALLVGLVMLGRLAITTLQEMGQDSAGGADPLAWLLSSAPTAVLLRTQVAPAVLALAASFACVAFCRRLAGGWSTR
jgi:hypothetical protein